jgi:LytS/YehU family sensor histidine kinase
LYTLVLVSLFALLDIARENYVLKTCASCMQEVRVSAPGYYQFLQGTLVPRFLGKVVSMGTLIGMIFSIAFPLSIKLGLQAFREQLRSVQLQRDNLQLEFDFLRSQVNPHFLFNTLNNIYGQILNDEKDKSAGLVARLSQVLRYTLYQSGAASANMDEEVQVLRDYIDLETVRLNHVKVNFEYRTDGSITTIAPLLMLPVVENAFKYCSDTEGAYINISMVIADKQIDFTSKNSVDPAHQPTSLGGIGLKNFSKRLYLYHPGKHGYNVTKSGKEYAVTVNINCNE